MNDRTWLVDVETSTITRHTITLIISAGSQVVAEAEARAQVRQLEHDDLPDGYHAIRWSVDNATAVEVP